MIGLLLWGVLAWGAPDAPEPEEEATPAERPVKGERSTPPARPEGPIEFELSLKRPTRGESPLDDGIRGDGWWSITRAEGATYDPAAIRGAEQLALPVAYVQGIRDGLHLAYLRDYDGARAHFHKLDNTYPGTGIAAAVDAVIWQAIMLENWDYRHEREYLAANAKAQTQLGVALGVAGSEGWEHFLLAGMKGIEAIHTMRREKYLSALQTALDAMTHAGKSREHAPAFKDLLLADGMYSYWRTVVSRQSRLIPDFGDKRAEGIAQMEEVERDGVFLGPPATLSLAFSFIEESEHAKALAATRRNHSVYPDNIINLLVMGQIQSYQRHFSDAHETWDQVLTVDPSNQRVLYWRGLTFLRSGKSADAIPQLETYLASGYLEPHHRSWTLYRLGEAYYRQKRYADAEASYTAAVKVDGHQSAKSALERMRASRREGRISY